MSLGLLAWRRLVDHETTYRSIEEDAEIVEHLRAFGVEDRVPTADQRRYFVPYPHCEAMQWLKFEAAALGEGAAGEAEYFCGGCERPIAEHHKTRMHECGEWRADRHGRRSHDRRLTPLGALLAVGWLSWQRIARANEAARGSDEAMRAFRNTILRRDVDGNRRGARLAAAGRRREAWSRARSRSGGCS